MKLQAKGSAGFSLVEVALSLAILAVGMVGVLALLPVGLEGARQVHAETVASQIVRGAVADFGTNGFSQTSYATIAGGNVPGPFFYDSEGKILASTQANRAYFRLEYTKGSGTSVTPSCRYYLRLSWPAAATNSPIVQSRTFVTDVVRNF